MLVSEILYVSLLILCELKVQFIILMKAMVRFSSQLLSVCVYEDCNLKGNKCIKNTQFPHETVSVLGKLNYIHSKHCNTHHTS